LTLSSADVEALAIDFYRRLKFDPERPVDTFRLARTLLGTDAIERGTALVGEPAKVFTVRGRRRIAISRKLAAEYSQFYVGHELGHIVFDELGFRDETIEQLCDMFGAAVMAPLPAVRAMLRVFGRDHAALADEVCSTQTWAALRIAEALGTPRAIVTPKRVYARGPEDFVWGPERELRRLARVERPGIARARLTDDPRRVVIDVDVTG
jgi:IrrE N-terminal-like domain